MISIGSMYRGPELKGSTADVAISVLTNAAIACRGPFDFDAGPAINVVFHVPGSLGSPDWFGIRDAKFSWRRQLLMVQVAVPSQLVNSPVLSEYLIESLHGANAVAFEFFRQKGIEYPLRDADGLVQRIKENVASQLGTLHHDQKRCQD